MALDRVARTYDIVPFRGISGDSARHGGTGRVACPAGASVYYHHARKADWMTRCIPGVRFITMLREPISQALSWSVMKWNRSFFIRPRGSARVCPAEDPSASLETQWRTLNACNASAETRKSLTMKLIAQEVRSWGPKYPGSGVGLTTKWVTSGRPYPAVSSAFLINRLTEEFYLVGVTEYLNEFLVMLAMEYDWSLESLYYRMCKPAAFHVRAEEFRREHPEEHETLRVSTTTMREAYEHMKIKFRERVEELGEPFRVQLELFEVGLRAFQANKTSEAQGWRAYRYIDGTIEYC